MAANPMISMAGAEAMLNALTALLNSGSIKIYSGSMPATCETASSGTLLSSGCTLSSTAFGNAADSGTGIAVATANAIATDTNCAASGTAGYFRGYSGSTCIIQGTVGTSSADMILASTTITMGGTLAISSWVINMPDGSGAD